jgi:hypothetical protein
MPVTHTIDTSRKLITTVWTGEASDSEFLAALSAYQDGIKCRPEYRHYDEILDLSGIGDFHLTAEGLRRLSGIGAGSDAQRSGTRLAIVVARTVVYGLARMYQTYRSFVPGATKELRIFRNSDDALKWVEEGRNTE